MRVLVVEDEKKTAAFLAQGLREASFAIELAHDGVDLISDALPFGRLWYTKVEDAIGYAKFRSRSDKADLRLR